MLDVHFFFLLDSPNGFSNMHKSFFFTLLRCQDSLPQSRSSCLPRHATLKGKKSKTISFGYQLTVKSPA